MNIKAPFRPVSIASWNVDVERDSNEAIYLRPTAHLGDYPARLTDRLDEWSHRDPSRLFLARRGEDGEWRKMTYGEFRRQARAIAQALLDRGLSAERPVVVLSGNDFAHALIEVGAMYAGIPYSPLTPAWSLLSSDFGKLRAAMRLLTPGLVFAADGEQFRRAIEAAVPSDARLVVADHPPAGRHAEHFSSLLETTPTEDVDRAHARVGPETVAKFLFTSGSADTPKAVINTQRMLCSNQQMLCVVFPVLAEQPPVICDWLPWHHTFGGNHNFGLVLYNGGSLYIDDGAPTQAGFGKTIRNLREVSPTVYFNVPKGYEMLVECLREQPTLRASFFRRLRMNFYAAASLPQHVWDELDAVAVKHCGQRIRMLTGLGMTETSPFAISASTGTARAGFIGLPVPGVELKLARVSEKMEIRYRGPNVTPGFWRQEGLTRAAFDEEGYFRSGDAALFLNPSSPSEGLLFDGRIAEDFKLSTGTWVSTGPLRMRFLAHFSPYVKDVVIAGHDRDEITALIFPDWEACRLACTADADSTVDEQIHSWFESLLTTFADSATGSSNRIERALILEEDPSPDAGEITAKGSINQRAVLAHRADLVEDLYRIPPPARVLAAGSSDRKPLPARDAERR
jgi:feruloyl-CoA synthase